MSFLTLKDVILYLGCQHFRIHENLKTQECLFSERTKRTLFKIMYVGLPKHIKYRHTLIPAVSLEQVNVRLSPSVGLMLSMLSVGVAGASRM